jgi:hypothetical protein
VEQLFYFNQDALLCSLNGLAILARLQYQSGLAGSFFIAFRETPNWLLFYLVVITGIDYKSISVYIFMFIIQYRMFDLKGILCDYI